MKQIKRIFTFLTGAAMLLSMSIPAIAAEGNFSDVPAGAWYAGAANWCREQDIFTENTFSPNRAMTRAAVAEALYRAEGSPASESVNFPDIPAGSIYASAASWAAANGVFSGYPDGTFGADDPVTREQMAAILWRSAGSPAAEAGQDFADEAQIAAFAQTAVDWARSSGVISGKEGNRFDPKGGLTRAQTAVILYQYLTAQNANPSTAPQPSGSGNTLVAYFSRTGENYGVGVIEKGNTEIVAEMIVEQVGGELFHIETVTPYPQGYDECTAVARQERDANARPALSGTVANMDFYDTVFLGYPIWYSDMPMAVYTFLESYDFSGKTMIPFSTHAGSGLAGTEQRIASACPGAAMLSGFTISGQNAQNSRETTRSAVQEWIDSLNLPASSSGTDSSSVTAITMTVGNDVMTAELSDSQTTRDFLALLPRTLTLSRYSDREYYGNPGGKLSENGEAIPDFENGDITLFPASGNLAIFFGNEDTSSQSGLIRMGKITSNLSVLENEPQTIEMRIELASAD